MFHRAKLCRVGGAENNPSARNAVATQQAQAAEAATERAQAAAATAATAAQGAAASRAPAQVAAATVASAPAKAQAAAATTPDTTTAGAIGAAAAGAAAAAAAHGAAATTAQAAAARVRAKVAAATVAAAATKAQATAAAPTSSVITVQDSTAGMQEEETNVPQAMEHIRRFVTKVLPETTYLVGIIHVTRETVQMLENALDKRAQIKEGPLNVALQEICEAANSSSLTVTAMDSYEFSRLSDAGGAKMPKGVQQRIRDFCDTVAEAWTDGVVAIPIFAGQHYVAACLNIIREGEQLTASFNVADGLTEENASTLKRATAIYQLVKEALGDKVEWAKDAFNYVALDQQNDKVADGGLQEWSCGLHMVANVHHMLSWGSWAQGLTDARRSGATYEEIRRKHWEIAVHWLGMALANKGWKPAFTAENTAGWEGLEIIE